MLHPSAAALLNRAQPFIEDASAVFRLFYRALLRLITLHHRGLRWVLQGRVSVIAGIMSVMGLLLAFAGCGGDGGGSNVPERVEPAPVQRHEPVAQDLSFTTNQDTPVVLKVLPSERDADGDLLSVVSVVQPRHGTVSINPDHTLP